MPKRRRLPGDFQPAQPVAYFHDPRAGFSHVIQLGVRIDPARDREPDQFHGRADRLPRIRVLVLEHEAADFDPSHATFEIKGGCKDLGRSR